MRSASEDETQRRCRMTQIRQIGFEQAGFGPLAAGVARVQRCALCRRFADDCQQTAARADPFAPALRQRSHGAGYDDDVILVLRFVSADSLGDFDGRVDDARRKQFCARLVGKPGNLPSVTGAREARVLGAVYPA